MLTPSPRQNPRSAPRIPVQCTRWLLVLLALTLAGCIPAGGGGGGDDDDGGGGGGGEGGGADRGAPDPDDGVPPPDGAIDPDDGVPPPDAAIDPDDGVPPPDRGPVADADPIEPDVECGGVERCNGIDDDCDGNADEDFGALGQPCSVGAGACQVDSTIVCSPDGLSATCDATVGAPAAESCNGIDDDCDGRLDEDVDGAACMTGELGRCAPGTLRCVGGEPVCSRGNGPRVEQCDQGDDDCDGRVDEGVCGEPVEQQCDDGIDNDGDGFIDCRDFDCDDLPICADEVERCENGVDDDGDGFVDCADFNCDDDPACEPVVAPECVGYVVLDQANRNVSTNNGLSLCDDNLGEVVPGRWHRFMGAAGAQMPVQPPAINACGTDATGWLNGAHPAVGAGIVNRNVCFNWDGQQCWRQVAVRVRNCGAFYVYELPRVGVCSTRFCGTGAGAPIEPGPDDRIDGVQQLVRRDVILGRGFRECHRSNYTAAGVPFANIRAACNGSEVMLACGRAGNATHMLAAEGARDDVFFNVGGGAAVTHAHNGVEWYYSPARSFGFAPGGGAVNLNSCDTNAGPDRMCVHLGAGDVLNVGYRCGDNALNEDATWERVIYTRTP